MIWTRWGSSRDRQKWLSLLLDHLLCISRSDRIDARYGSNLVQACADNGTHYADITGESPWYGFLYRKANLGSVNSFNDITLNPPLRLPSLSQVAALYSLSLLC